MKKLLILLTLTPVFALGQTYVRESFVNISVGGTLSRVDDSKDMGGQEVMVGIGKDYFNVLRIQPTLTNTNYSTILKSILSAEVYTGLVLRANTIKLIPQVGLGLNSIELRDHSTVRGYSAMGGLEINAPMTYTTSVGVSYFKKQVLAPTGVQFNTDTVGFKLTVHF